MAPDQSSSAVEEKRAREGRDAEDTGGSVLHPARRGARDPAPAPLAGPPATARRNEGLSDPEGLLARRLGKTALSPAVPPAEVARLFGEAALAGGRDAQAVVETYCASAFGGIRTGPEAERALSQRLRRLRKLA